MSSMDSRKIFNTDQIGLSPYNKMEEDSQSSNGVNGYAQNGKVLNANIDNSTTKCMWPHHWTLNECCCGCSLRVACLLIGWFYMIGSSLLLFSFMYLPIAITYRWEDVIFTALKFVASIILLVGTYKDLVRVIRTAAVLYVLDVIVEVILGIVVSVQLAHPYPILVLVIGVPLAVYFLVAVNSYANELSAKQAQRNSLTAHVV